MLGFRKILSLFLVALLVSGLIPTMHVNAEETTIQLSGTDGFTSNAYTSGSFDGYLLVYAKGTFSGTITIKVRASEHFESWITWNDVIEFDLAVGQVRDVGYTLNIPALSPGNYTSPLLAETIIPSDANPASGSGSAEVTFNVGKEVYFEVPSEVQIDDFNADHSGVWVNLTNYDDAPFSGSINYRIWQGTTLVEELNTTISGLNMGNSLSDHITWATSLTPAVNYEAIITIYDTAMNKFNDRKVTFHVPSPADILSVDQNPSRDEIVYTDNIVSVFVKLRSMEPSVNLTYAHGGGTSQTLPMHYNVVTKSFVAQIPAAPVGIVNYRVTSNIGAVIVQSSAYEYSIWPTDAPDLSVGDLDITITPNIVDIAAQIKNVGRGSVSDFIVYLIVDGVKAGERMITAEPGSAIALEGGENQTVYFSWEHAAGNYTIGILVDAQNAITDEVKEDNNLRERGISIPIFTTGDDTSGEDEPVPVMYVFGAAVVIIMAFLLLIMAVWSRSKSMKTRKNIIEDDEDEAEKNKSKKKK